MAKPRVSVKVIRNDLPRIAGELPHVAEMLNQEAAENIAEGARQRVHVITGKTKASIEVDYSDPMRPKVRAGEGAIFEEYGTVYRPPHPFLTPAAEEERPRLFAKYRNLEKYLR